MAGSIRHLPYSSEIYLFILNQISLHLLIPINNEQETTNFKYKNMKFLIGRFKLRHDFD